MQFFKLKNEVYHLPIRLIIWENPEEVFAKLNERYEDKDLAKYAKTFSKQNDGAYISIDDKETGQRYYIVWLKRFDPKNSASWASLAHELHHLLGEQFDDLGIKDDRGGEAEAYYFGYLFEQAVKVLMRKKK